MFPATGGSAASAECVRDTKTAYSPTREKRTDTGPETISDDKKKYAGSIGNAGNRKGGSEGLRQGQRNRRRTESGTFFRHASPPFAFGRSTGPSDERKRHDIKNFGKLRQSPDEAFCGQRRKPREAVESEEDRLSSLRGGRHGTGPLTDNLAGARSRGVVAPDAASNRHERCGRTGGRSSQCRPAASFPHRAEGKQHAEIFARSDINDRPGKRGSDFDQAVLDGVDDEVGRVLATGLGEDVSRPLSTYRQGCRRDRQS